MRKYSIVYGEWFNIGSYRHSIVKLDFVETDNLAELILQEKYNNNIHFVLEGWVEQTKD